VSALTDRTYRNLLTAQVVALLGTGLATAELGLGLTASAAAGAMVIADTVVIMCNDLGLGTRRRHPRHPGQPGPRRWPGWRLPGSASTGSGTPDSEEFGQAEPSG